MRHRTPPQRRISESQKRFNVAAWGRQSGKTTYGIDKMLWKPLVGREGGIYWYILQTHATAKIAFLRYKELLRPTPWLTIGRPNQADKIITLANHATVRFVSGQNYEDLRMETLDGCIIDEVRQQHPDLWPVVIRPMLTRRKGWCDFLSTPNGFDHFYDLANFAQQHSENLNWGYFHAPSHESWWNTPEELDSARAQTSEEQYAQEFDAEFREIGKGKTYLSHGPHNWSEQNPFAALGERWSPYLPIIVGLDFNVAVMPWVLGQKKGDQFYFGDEVCLTQTNTEMQAPMLAEKLKGHPAGVILIGDASGNARSTSAAGKTDYSIICQCLQQAGIKFQNLTPESNPLVKDRINAVNRVLRAADGTVGLWYSPTRCPRLKRDLERVVWKEGATGAMLDKTKIDLTHASDAFGYPIAYYVKPWEPKPGVTRVIMR